MERADEARKARSAGSRNEMFWRIIWPVVVVIIFGGAMLFANGCGGGGGGSDGTKAENSDLNQNNNQNPPTDQNANPPADNNDTTPPPDNTDTNPPPDNSDTTSLPNIKTAGTIQLPKTGQTVSYAKGDDGDIQSGVLWPNPRFIDNGNNTITDKLTGLMWMKRSVISQYKVSALDAAVYVDKLNRGFINSGTPYIDWRIPNVNELRSVNDFSKNDAALSPIYFPNIKNDLYWTSTTLNVITLAVNPKTGSIERLSSNYYYRDDLEEAYLWLVRGLSTGSSAIPKTGQKKCYGPNDGSTSMIDCNERIGWITKSGDSCFYNWWVYDYSYGTPIKREYKIQIPCDGARQDGQYQAGIDWPDSRFIDGINVVTDQLTGLMWTKNSRLKENASWQQALDFTAQMNKENKFGYSDWRLPNINELFSVIDCSGMNSSDGCANFPIFSNWGIAYWSSTTYAGDENYAWYWASWFFESGIHHGPKNDMHDVWLVRTVPAQ